MSGGGKFLEGVNFQKASGFMQNDGVFWSPSTGGQTLAGPILTLYEQAGSDNGRGDFAGLFYESSGISGTYGLPKSTVITTLIGHAQQVTFQNGALMVSNGAPGEGAIEEMSVLQEGNTIVFSWQTAAPTEAVLVGVTANNGPQQQTGRLPANGPYVLANVTSGVDYTFRLDLESPGALFRPHYSGWLPGVSYVAHS